MRKLYLTYNNKENKTESYSYSGDTNPIYTELADKELEAYLGTILKDKVRSTRSINDNILEVMTESGELIVLDSIRVFKENRDIKPYYTELQTRIKTSLENNNIDFYKKRLPDGYIPKVNRKRRGKYLVEEGNMATSLILSGSYTELSMDLSDIEMYNSEITRGR